MRAKHILAGFAVSFAGSLPMGYLNIAAWKIFSMSGTFDLAMFLLGVVVIEGLLVLLIASSVLELSRNKKLMRWIGWVSAAFLILLAAIFFMQGNANMAREDWEFVDRHAFFAGIILSAGNIMQVPFWTGWCLYLLQGGFIREGRNVGFALSAMVGTFLGMGLIVIALHRLSEYSNLFGNILVSRVMPVIFLLMAGVQIWKLRYPKD